MKKAVDGENLTLEENGGSLVTDSGRVAEPEKLLGLPGNVEHLFEMGYCCPLAKVSLAECFCLVIRH